MSSNLAHCPHCQAERPSGKSSACVICGKSLELSHTNPVFFHEACFASYKENVLNTQFSCQTCHYNYSYRDITKNIKTEYYGDTGMRDIFTCSECGERYEILHYIPSDSRYFIRACRFCEIIIPPNDIVKVGSATARVGHGSDYCTHSRCLEYYRKNEKESKKQRIKDELKGACYIATACYGSYDAPEVVILRDYRDKYLSKTLVGKGLIKLYYRYSPYFAEKLKNNTTIAFVMRKYLIDRIVKVIKNSMAD